MDVIFLLRIFLYTLKLYILTHYESTKIGCSGVTSIIELSSKLTCLKKVLYTCFLSLPPSEAKMKSPTFGSYIQTFVYMFPSIFFTIAFPSKQVALQAIMHAVIQREYPPKNIHITLHEHQHRCRRPLVGEYY